MRPPMKSWPNCFNELNSTSCLRGWRARKGYHRELQIRDLQILPGKKSTASIPPSNVPSSKVLHAIESKAMRLEHNIHATSQLNVVAPSKPRVIVLFAILATLVSQELIAAGSDIVVAIAVLALSAEGAEDLSDCEFSGRE